MGRAGRPRKRSQPVDFAEENTENHFSAWVDFAGNAVQGPPFDFNGQTTPVMDDGLTFPNFNDPPNPLLQTNLFFPVPCEFISPNLPKVSVLLH